MKFLHYHLKQLLEQERFTFKAVDSGSQSDNGSEKPVVSEKKDQRKINKQTAEATEAALQQEVASIEQNIANKKSVQEAVKTAKINISELTTKALEKISPPTEGDPDGETRAFLKRVTDAEEKALDEIDENQEQYVTLENYVNKAAQLRATMVKNETVLEFSNGDVEYLYALDLAIKGMESEKAEVEAMDLEATAVKGDKQKLLKEIDAHTNALSTKWGEIAGGIHDQVVAKDALLNAVAEELKNSEAIPQFKSIDELLTHLEVLDHMKIYLQKNLPTATDLIANLDAKIKAITPIAMEANKRFLDASPAVKGLLEQKVKLEKNLKNAQVNYDRLKANPATTKDQLREAQGWVAGAQQTLDKHKIALLAATNKADDDLHPAPVVPEVPDVEDVETAAKPDALNERNDGTRAA